MRKAISDLDAAGQHWGGDVVMCFNPRHGVRIRSGDTTHDLIICYECSQVMIFRGDMRVGDIFFSSSDGTLEPGPDALNGILTAHGIAIQQRPKE